MTMRDRLNVSSGSPFEPTIGFSRAVRIADRVVVSGTAPVWPDGHVDPDPRTQAQRCWQIALEALAQAGGEAGHVVRTRQYLTDASVQDAAGAVHGEIFGEIRPAATMVVVAALLDPRWVMEVELEAVLPPSAPPARLNRVIVSVSSLRNGLAFYRDVVGLTVVSERPGFATLASDGVEVALHERHSEPSDLAVALSFAVANLDGACGRVEGVGGAIVDPPADQPWGERMAMVRDPEGHLVCLVQAVRADG